MLTQLKTSQIKSLTTLLKSRQEYKCAICERSLAYGRIALDHNHKNGRVRAVLCGQCNRSEGKVRFGMIYMAVSGHMTRTNPITWLRNLADYLEYHENNPGSIVHPSFDIKTGKQKPKTRKKKSTTKVKPKAKTKRRIVK